MKKALAVALATVLLGVCTGGALAQVPFIQVYFDADYNETQSNCKPVDSESFLYVAALNLNMLVSAIDYKVLFPPAVLYVDENVNVTGSDPVIGNSYDGIGIAYALPRNGFLTLLLSRVRVMWTAQCDCALGPQPLRVAGFDDIFSPQPKVVRFPDNAEFPVVGMTSLICPGSVSTESTTWGGVKALYR
jgi:hypothetical protein